MYRPDNCRCLSEDENDQRVLAMASAMASTAPLVSSQLGLCDRAALVATVIAAAQVGVMAGHSHGEVKEQINEAARMARRWVDSQVAASGAPLNDNRGDRR